MTDKTPKDQKPAKGKREYVVLEKTDLEGHPAAWLMIARLQASTERAAKRAAILDEGNRKYEMLVAIPARSWNPTTPKVTAQTVLKIEGV